MSSDDIDSTRRPPRLQFSLSALLILMTLVCMALYWWTRPRPLEVVALLNVRSQTTNLTGAGNAGRDWEIIQRTQLAFLKSVGVLQAALSDPQVAKMPLVTNEADPVAWLQNELRIKFEQNSEILSVRLSSPSNQSAQAQTLLSAVISAYLQSVTAAEQQQLQLQLQNQQAEYDALREQIKELSEQIATLHSQRGPDDAEAKLLQLEADRHVEQAGKLKAVLELGKTQGTGPPRVRLIQPPIVLK